MRLQMIQATGTVLRKLFCVGASLIGSLYIAHSVAHFRIYEKGCDNDGIINHWHYAG